MGQQQMLLVILMTILVGIATIVALNFFSTRADQANRDAVRQDILSAAANAESYYIRPASRGGGDGDFNELELEHLGLPGRIEGNEVINDNGVYSISEPDELSFEIRAELATSNDVITATISIDSDDQYQIDWNGGGD